MYIDCMVRIFTVIPPIAISRDIWTPFRPSSMSRAGKLEDWRASMTGAGTAGAGTVGAGMSRPGMAW